MASETSTTERGVSAIILAAGKGTRMQSDLPKVCHPVGGRAMVCAVVDACIEAGVDHIVVVVGYRRPDVMAALRPYAGVETLGAGLGPPMAHAHAGDAGPEGLEGAGSEERPRAALEFAVQSVQLGTGHAVSMARMPFDRVLLQSSPPRDVFVLCGDGPLIRASTLRTMLERHRSGGGVAAATLATSVIEDPTGYGRIVRDGEGRFERIVEHKNASEAERAIREVNPSYYCFDVAALFRTLSAVTPDSATGEYYITDVFELLLREGERVEVIDAVPPEDVLSINTPEQLAEVDRMFRSRRGEGSSSRKGTPG